MRRGQSTVEYVIWIGFAVASLILMGAYMMRGFQGNIRNQADQIGGQYSPGNTRVDNTLTQRIISTERTTYTDSEKKTESHTETLPGSTISRTVDETLQPLANESWR